MSVYHEELKIKETQLLREVQQDLPPFLQEFFRGISQTTSTKTRLAYAYDLRVFFRYLYEEHDKLGGIAAQNLQVTDLNQITSEDIDCFLEYLSYYVHSNSENPAQQTQHHNEEKGNLASSLPYVPCSNISTKGKTIGKSGDPCRYTKNPRKKITRLDVNEMANFLDAVESGEYLTDRQKARHEKTKKRDLALITLLLGTGMRVSECVGINRKDLDFQNHAVKVLRKGGNEVMLYFGEEVAEALSDYLEERNQTITKEDGEDALFLSSQGKRISVRAVQNLVKICAWRHSQKHFPS